MKKQIILLTLILAVLSPMAFASMQGTFSDWEPKYEGIWFATFVDDELIPHRAYAVKIDTKNPAIEFYITEGTGNSPSEFLRKRPSDFLDEENLKVAINANFFSLTGCTSGYANACGEVRSEGVQYSVHSNSFKGKFLCYSGNEVYCLNQTTTSQAGKTVSGQELIVSNGVNVSTNFPFDPLDENWQRYELSRARTGIGVSADNRFVYFVVVEQEPENNWAVGMTVDVFCEMLIEFGCDDAVLLDGGSSSMLCAEWEGDDRVTIPENGDPEDAVAVNIGADSDTYDPRVEVWTLDAAHSFRPTKKVWTRSADSWSISWSWYMGTPPCGAISAFGGIAVVSRTVDRYHYFVLGTDGKVYQRWQVGDSFGSWTALPTPPSTVYSPLTACASNDDRMDVAFIGLNGRMYRIGWNGSSWAANWMDHGGDFETLSKPAIASWGRNRIDIFGQKDAGGIHRKYSTNGGSTWTDWATLTGSPATGLDVCSEKYGKYNIVYVKSDGHVEYRELNWSTMSGPTDLGSGFAVNWATAPAICSFENGRRSVFAQTEHGTVCRKDYTSGSGWSSSWTTMSCPVYDTETHMCADSWSNTPGTHTYLP